MGAGRPIEWTPERMEDAKSLYLNLVSLGKTEAEINEVEGLPSWAYRYAWQNDVAFLTHLQEARRKSASIHAYDAIGIVKEAYDRALDEAASPQLVSAANNYAKVKLMVAAKLDKDTWGDSVRNEHTGKNGEPIQSEITVRFVKGD